MKLTVRQEVFCREYLVDLNATKAAIRAGYSKRSARSVGSENMTKPDIAARINTLMEERMARTDAKADRTLEELEAVAYSDIADFLEVRPDGAVCVRDPSTLPPQARRAIRSIRLRLERERDADGQWITTPRYEVVLWDKLAAMQMLARHYGLLDGPEPQEQEAGETEVRVTMVIPRADGRTGSLVQQSTATDRPPED
jgi:phage terminase small subunit